MSLQIDKKTLRNEVFIDRELLTKEVKDNFDTLICEKVIKILIDEAGIGAGDTVLSYMDFRGEAGTGMIHEKLWELGVKVAVPKTYGKNQPMRFFYINDNNDTEEGNFHVPEPKAGLEEAADLAEGTPVIVPGVVFSKNFVRIGYGAGFYDRFFTANPGLKKIAIAYPFQFKEVLQAEDHDVPMDMIVAPNQIIRRYDAILFDMDGTLIDTEKYYRIAWPQAAREFGFPMTDEQALSMRSLGRPFAIEHIRDMFGEEADYKKIRTRREEIIQDLIAKEGIKAKAGAATSLKYLKKKGYRLAITTATDIVRTERYLKMVGLYDYFDDIICATMVSEGKPSPLVYQYACEKLGVNPADTLAVEDAPNGIRSAKAAGLNVCMIPDQSEPDDEIASLMDIKCASLIELAEYVTGDTVKIKVDLHMHSTASDGTNTPEELVKLVREAGITRFALTDHDTIKGISEVLKQDLTDLEFLPGVEFSCKTEFKKCHIIAFFAKMEHPAFLSLLNYGKSLRKEKFEKRIIWLKEQFGIEFTPEVLEELRGNESVGKPHIAAELVKLGKARSVGEAIAYYFDGLKEKDDKIPSDIAIKGITDALGIAVWAHPLGGEGEKHFSEEEFNRQLSILKAQGIGGMECYYSRYSMEECRFLLKKAQEANLLVSGGSDYHGTVKSINLAELNTEGVIVTEEMLDF